uniref:Uncharacterized protein n=1 Tax=Romanomermis culicivorax TaxID=13658 RepID=A0A915IET0_ROMCU
MRKELFQMREDLPITIILEPNVEHHFGNVISMRRVICIINHDKFLAYQTQVGAKVGRAPKQDNSLTLGFTTLDAKFHTFLNCFKY